MTEMAQKTCLKKRYSLVNIVFLFMTLSLFAVGFFCLDSNSITKSDIKSYIAKVDGKGISRAGFEAQAQLETKGMMTLGGDNSLEKSLRRQILATQIDNYLGYKLSTDLNATVSDQQVQKEIQTQRIFFDDGKFDQQKFLKLLNANGYSLDEYIASTRDALQKKQVIEAITQTDFALPNESLELSELNTQSRTAYITYITSGSVADADADITQDDLLEYYNTHKDFFYRKERVKLKYVINFYPELVKQNIEISDDDMKKEYKKNPENYMHPAKQLFSIKIFDSIDTANSVYNQLLSGVPTNNSMGDSKQLGWFSMDKTLPQFLLEANLNQKGAYSKPIAVNDKFVIVTLDDMQSTKLKPFALVANEIMNTIKNKKIDVLFKEKNELMNQALKNHPISLEDIAKESKLELYETEWNYYDESYSILRYPEIRDIVFSDEMIKNDQLTNKISDLIYTAKYNSTFIFQVVEHRNSGIAEFDEVKDEIYKQIQQEKSKLNFKDNVNDRIKELQEKGQTDHIVFSSRYKLERTLDTNNDTIPFNQKVVDMIFNLIQSPDGSSVYGVEYLDDNRAYIAAMINTTNLKEIPDISQHLRSEIINNNIYYLAGALRSKSQIEIMPNSNL